MGKYFDNHINEVVPTEEREAITSALSSATGWRELVDTSSPELRIESWESIFGPITAQTGGSHNLGTNSGWGTGVYDDLFKNTTIGRKGIPGLTIHDLNVLGLSDSETDDLVAQLEEQKNNPSYAAEGGALSVYYKEINSIIGDALKIPGNILPRPNQKSWNDYEYSEWHKAPEVQDMKDVLLYLYLEKSNSRRNSFERQEEVINAAEESLDALDPNSEAFKTLKQAIDIANSEKSQNKPLSEKLSILLENSDDPDFLARSLRESAQCVLRLNIGNYVKAHKISDKSEADANPAISNTPRYNKSVYLSYGNAATIINKLAHCENSQDFLNIKTHQVSQLVPMIRLFKSYYEEDNVSNEVEIQFGAGVLGPRSGVGIKSFDWKLNATNPATVKNDIDVTLVLFFQSFNELLTPQQGTDIITGLKHTFKYEDLLLRPPVEGTLIKTSEPPPSGPNCTEDNNTIYDPRFYEIKALVGWASHPGQSFSTDLANSIASQKLPLFLTLIDHEFTITQEGTFELSISYRARLEAIENDPRMDVLSTTATKEKIDKALKRLMELKTTCGSESLVESQQRKIANLGESDRDYLAKSLIKDLQSKIYFTKVLRKDFYSTIFDQGSDTEGSIYGLRVTEDEIRSSIITTRHKLQKRAARASEGSTADGLSGTHPGYDSEEEEKRESERDLATGFLSWSNAKVVEIPWFYFGDLANAVINRCFDVNIAKSKHSHGAIAAVELKNMLFLFSSFKIKEIGKNGLEDTIEANLTDVPISLELFNQWYIRNVVRPGRTNYPILEFLRDFISDAVLGTLNNACYDDDNSFRSFWFNAGIIAEAVRGEAVGQGLALGQGGPPWALPPPMTLFEIPRLLMKTAALSMPSLSKSGDPIKQGDNDLGGNPLEKLRSVPSTKYTGRYPAAVINLNGMNPSELNLARRADSFSQSLQNSYHLNVFYLISSDNYLEDFGPGGTQERQDGFPTREARDLKNGVFHLYLGADRGLVKSVNFSKVSAQYLREARIQQRALNPLSQLAATYNVNLKLIGNTIFWPGQYIFVNPIGFGNKLGLPYDTKGGDGNGSISNQLGLGGYHLVTEVNSFLESGKFETEVKALFEFSGDGCPSLPGATPAGLNCSGGSTSSKGKNVTKPATSPEAPAGTEPVSSAPAGTGADGKKERAVYDG